MSSIVVAFSGGKDSTAMALLLAARGERFTLLFTATGNELPGVVEHVESIAHHVGAPLVCPPAPSLLDLIDELEALPNWRQRWCTRMIKIVPCIAYLRAHPGSTLCVGLRADEPAREGLYGDYAKYRYPLREMGMNVGDVRRICADAGIVIPTRTDCALCYGQRLGEWFALWRDFPDHYAAGEKLEGRIGHTFRSPGRDTWPASLRELRRAFEAGRRPRGLEASQAEPACRVCRV